MSLRVQAALGALGHGGWLVVKIGVKERSGMEPELGFCRAVELVLLKLVVPSKYLRCV